MRMLNLKAHKAVAEKKKYALKPRGKWVLVRKVTPPEKVTEGGIIVDMSQARSAQAEVIEVGSEVLDLGPSDLVLMSNFPMEIEDVEELTGEKNLYLIREEEIYSRVVERACE